MIWALRHENSTVGSPPRVTGGRRLILRHGARMGRRGRILAVTAGLAMAGGVFGALAAMIPVGAISAWFGFDGDIVATVLAVAGGTGAVLGAVLGPAVGWAVLRTVPLGRAIGGTFLGTLVGGCIGLAAGFIGVSLGMELILPWAPLFGAILGFGAAAAALARRYRSVTRAGVASPSESDAEPSCIGPI